MPLGNLTSQFFANIYLNELDYFVKHKLKTRYYIRYVDDFIILHSSKEQLETWREEINKFLREELKLELHSDNPTKSTPRDKEIILDFRNFYHYKLVRKRNIRKMNFKIGLFDKNKITYQKMMEIYLGWQAYVSWANSFNLRKETLKKIAKIKHKKIDEIIKKIKEKEISLDKLKYILIY